MEKSNTAQISSFPPITGLRPKIFILGSIPGKESLRKGEYYGHPRNSFWEILSSVTGIPFDRKSYSSKRSLITKADIALWDVCSRAFRETSLDSDIRNETPNPLDTFMTTHSTIRGIFFNGQKAAQLYDRYFDRNPDIHYVTLLSTSPANASYSFTEKRENWQNAFSLVC